MQQLLDQWRALPVSERYEVSKATRPTGNVSNRVPMMTSFLVRYRLVRRAAHIEFIRRNLFEPRGSMSLDSGRPWFVYWSLQALTRLGADVSTDESHQLTDFLRRCQAPSGGFGGGPGQLPHLAPSFAAVSALMILGGEYAYSAIDRCAMRITHY